jgi:hypothetical protein
VELPDIGLAGRKNMVQLGRGQALRAASVAAAFAIFASATLGLGRYPFDAVIPDSLRNTVVRVTGPNANPNLVSVGTGTVFHIAYDDPQNQNSGGWLCVLTADHVVNLDGSWAIGFGDGNPAGNTDPALNNLTAQRRIKVWGTRNANNETIFPDVAVLGARFANRKNLPEMTLPRLAEHSPSLSNDLVQSGYGRPGLPRLNGANYEYAAPNQYGTYRAGQNTIDRYVNDFELAGPKNYKFLAFQGDWDRFQYGPGLTGGESYIFSGDSGGPTFVDNEGIWDLVGVHSASQRTLGEFEVAREGTDLWTDVDVATYRMEIERACLEVVPEPSSMIALAAGGLALLARRRRKA